MWLFFIVVGRFFSILLQSSIGRRSKNDIPMTVRIFFIFLKLRRIFLQVACASMVQLFTGNKSIRKNESVKVFEAPTDFLKWEILY
jgi:hypothetical protein